MTVLGGTGYTGTNVVRTAAARGHTVTSVSRSLPAEKVDGVTYVQSSVTRVDPASLVTASDVVVGALSPNSGELMGKLGGIYQSLAPALAAMGTRLVVIGGFSALRRVAGGPRIAFSEEVNPLFAAAAREVAAIADWLPTTPAELAWTYISPARLTASATPERRGAGTGSAAMSRSPTPRAGRTSPGPTSPPRSSTSSTAVSITAPTSASPDEEVHG
ncbi:MAG TPA: NAD(P)H-binding protein [Streptosporangiaceae bacterium]|nr:NAD(P)H-binding protein [Streptosporangiaceae bacterium]